MSYKTFYLLNDELKDRIVDKLDHIRRNALDRKIITDDCDLIESIISGLKTI